MKTKRIPYTAETFPMDAVWIRKKEHKVRHSILSVFNQEIVYRRYEEDKTIKERDDTATAIFKYHQEEKPWYETIPKEGMWCCVYNKGNKSKHFDIIKERCIGFSGEPYFYTGQVTYENATPLTEEEKEKYLINYKP